MQLHLAMKTIANHRVCSQLPRFRFSCTIGLAIGRFFFDFSVRRLIFAASFTSFKGVHF
jgi:hypothetical protein